MRFSHSVKKINSWKNQYAYINMRYGASIFAPHELLKARGRKVVR